MNYAMAISCSMEDKLKATDRRNGWTQTDEAEGTAFALDRTLEEWGGVAWADGNIRIGDYILVSKSRQLC